MAITLRGLARLAFSYEAMESSEQAVDLVSAYADGFGRGAFLTEETAGFVRGAEALLRLAVIADRCRGVSWEEIGEALGVSKQAAHERFAGAVAEFREQVLFPHRRPAGAQLGYTVAPHPIGDDVEGVLRKLDEWVIGHERSSGRNRDEPEPVTRGVVDDDRRWVVSEIDLIGELVDRLINGNLPDDVEPEQAKRVLHERKVAVYERMLELDPENEDAAKSLEESRAALANASS
jgi:hypothetical protein